MWSLQIDYSNDSQLFCFHLRSTEGVQSFFIILKTQIKKREISVHCCKKNKLLGHRKGELKIKSTLLKVSASDDSILYKGMSLTTHGNEDQKKGQIVS